MAEGEGLLGQQLGAAVQIPYENIKANQTSLEQGLGAFFTAQQIKLKRQDLEGKMQALVVRNRQLEMNDQLREREMGIRLAATQMSGALRQQQQDIELRRMAQQKDDSDRKFGHIMDAYDTKQDQINARGEAQSKLFSLDHDLVAEGYKQGTTEYQTEMLRRSWELSKDLTPAEFNKLRTSVIDNANLQSKRQQELDAFEEKQFRQNVGAELFNNPQIDGLSAIMHPENLWDETKKDHWWETETPTGKKRIDYIDPTTGHRTKVSTATPQRLTELNEQWQEMQQRHSHTAKPPSGLKDDDSEAAPADPSQRKVDKVYTLPKGKFRWTADQGWVPP
jgi:hypothetical protein